MLAAISDGGTYRLLHKIVNRAGISVSLVDTSDLDALERAITPATKLLWIETPGNPLMSLTDIAACVGDRPAARRAGGGRQYLCHAGAHAPLELGADIVMHSATKYLGGHSDLLGGALVVVATRRCTTGCISFKTLPAA